MPRYLVPGANSDDHHEGPWFTTGARRYVLLLSDVPTEPDVMCFSNGEIITTPGKPYIVEASSLLERFVARGVWEVFDFNPFDYEKCPDL